MNESVGVIVGRFQCAELTTGHKELIEFVEKQKHNQILIVLGIAGTPCTHNNPLHYTARVAMMRETHPQFIYMPLHDNPCDIIWSKQLDQIIEMAFPYTTNITLYGSRDSFKKCYHGKFNVTEFQPKTYSDATKEREKYGSSVGFSKDYRHGVIYGAHQKFPTMYQTIDILIFKKLSEYIVDCEVVVGTKKVYGDKYLFPGGFVDPFRDENLIDTCYHETLEETNLSLNKDSIKYIGSFVVDDYRYKREKDKIMTHVHYVVCSDMSTLSAGDDLDTVKVVNLCVETDNNMHKSCKKMIDMVIKKLNLKYKL